MSYYPSYIAEDKKTADRETDYASHNIHEDVKDQKPPSRIEHHFFIQDGCKSVKG